MAAARQPSDGSKSKIMNKSKNHDARQHVG